MIPAELSRGSQGHSGVTTLSQYLRMEEIDDTEDIGFYVPGAGELDDSQRKRAITLRAQQFRADLEDLVFLEALENEWN